MGTVCEYIVWVQCVSTVCGYSVWVQCSGGSRPTASGRVCGYNSEDE
jgi:hypothetical protein